MRQYHLGTENTAGSFRPAFGIQYMEIVPRYDTEYWHSVLFGLGRAGEGKALSNLTATRAFFVTAGFKIPLPKGYLRYGMGQFVPLSLSKAEKKKKDDGGGKKGKDGDDSLSAVWDAIRNHPGGNFQQLQLCFDF